MITSADKARRAIAALDQLSEEYAGRPDVQHAVGEFLSSVGPSQLGDHLRQAREPIVG